MVSKLKADNRSFNLSIWKTYTCLILLIDNLFEFKLETINPKYKGQDVDF